jgi:hypothetical protein
METVAFYFLPAVVPMLEKHKGLYRAWCVVLGWSILCNAVGAYATWNWEKIALGESVWKFQAFPPFYLIWSLFH